MMKRDENDHEVTGGNVFADLELTSSEELLAKAELVRQITSIATSRQLTQVETAGILGTTQPKVSDLYAGKLAGFSLERLMRFLNALGCDIHIVVLPRPQARGRGTTEAIAGGSDR